MYLDNIMPELSERTMVRKNDLSQAKKKGEDIRKDIANLKDDVNEIERKCEKVKDDILNVNKGVESYVWNGILIMHTKKIRKNIK